MRCSGKQGNREMPGQYQIMRAIQEGLDGLKGTPIDDWSVAVLTKLCEIGKEYSGVQVGANSGKVDKTKRDWGEWLYDVTWLEYGDGRVVEVPLVAECDWGNLERITEDFDKLLLARSSVRLMICEGNRKRSSNRTSTITEELARRVREFNGSRAEDAWLLAIYEDNRDDLPEGSEQKVWWFRYFTIGKYSKTGLNGFDCLP